MEAPENQITINRLTVGTRLIMRSKKDWRMAVVSKVDCEKVTLIVCSPTGRTYRLRRTLETKIFFDGEIPLLKIKSVENWRGNLSKYDLRW